MSWQFFDEKKIGTVIPVDYSSIATVPGFFLLTNLKINDIIKT